MHTCVIVPPVTNYIDPEDPRATAHQMPMAMATETLQDIISSADLLQKAIIDDASHAEQAKIREIGIAQCESYFDLMAEAARHSRALKP
jgi:2-C-methyl-D-erythritol 4-phosphate cytidylyltransferase